MRIEKTPTKYLPNIEKTKRTSPVNHASDGRIPTTLIPGDASNLEIDNCGKNHRLCGIDARRIKIQQKPYFLRTRLTVLELVAMLMIEAVRSIGMAARFVSGYLHVPDHNDADRIGLPRNGWNL